jgi:hypothetical protein
VDGQCGDVGRADDVAVGRIGARLSADVAGTGAGEQQVVDGPGSASKNLASRSKSVVLKAAMMAPELGAYTMQAGPGCGR